MKRIATQPAAENKKRVLGDHKRVGKRFIPPLAQLDFKSVSYIEYGIPELLWLSLLNISLGRKRGADIAARIAKVVPKASDGAGEKKMPTWCAAASVLGEMDVAFRERARAAIGEDHADVVAALGPLARQYPSFPLAFLSDSSDGPAQRSTDLVILKSAIKAVFSKRSVGGVFMQAPAIYMAFVAGQLVVKQDSLLAKFPTIEDFPKTEESKGLAALVCATVNTFLAMVIVQGARTGWSRDFWNRGLQLEPIDAGLIDRVVSS